MFPRTLQKYLWLTSYEPLFPCCIGSSFHVYAPHMASDPSWHQRNNSLLAHLWGQDVEVPGAIGSTDELAFVPRRHSRVFGHPRDGGREPVGTVVVAVESLTLFFSKALSWDCQETSPVNLPNHTISRGIRKRTLICTHLVVSSCTPGSNCTRTRG